MKISIEHYIATNNPNAVNQMFAKRGIPASKNLQDSIQKIRFIMSKEGDSAAKELANIDTPYHSLIESSHDVKSNACGCSGADGSNEESSNCSGKPDCGCDKKSNADDANAPLIKLAAPQPTTEKGTIEKYIPLISVGLLLVVVTAVLVKK